MNMFVYCYRVACIPTIRCRKWKQALNLTFLEYVKWLTTSSLFYGSTRNKRSNKSRYKTHV